MTGWTVLSDVWRVVWHLSVQAAFVAVLILGVQVLARRWLTPQWRYALWTVLLLRLVMVYAIPASFSVHNATDWAAEATASLSPASAPSQPIPAESTSTVAPPGQSGFTMPSQGDVVTSIWLLGMLALGGVVLFQARRTSRAVSEGVLVKDPASLNLLESCRAALGIRSWLVLIETNAVKSPTLMGALRPKLLLPKGFLASVPPEQLRLIFLHEFMHFKRGDIWTGWLLNLLLLVHWFNPVFWWIRRRILSDRECACDAAVLTTLARRDHIAYGETMLDLAERFTTQRRWAPGMAGILETSDNLKRRIDMVTQYKPRTRLATVVGAVLLLTLGAVGLTDAQAGKPVLSAEKAEMMGRVEDFFCHNFQDISARKSLEWGDVETAPDGNRSIRYMCEARIWDKETKILNRVFTFDAKGEFVRSEEVEGYPKDKEVKAADPTTKEGIQALVEDFFNNNYRDITARKNLEWDDVEKNKDGNYSILYKFEARIRDSDTIVQEKRFTFAPDGKFVRVDDISTTPK